MARRFTLFALVALLCLVCGVYNEKIATQKVNVASLSTQEIEEQLQVSLLHMPEDVMYHNDMHGIPMTL